MNELALRATIADIERYRAAALSNFSAAMQSLCEAEQAISRAAPGADFRFSDDMLNALGVRYSHRNGKAFDLAVRQETDRILWRHIVTAYGFEPLMDRRAWEEFSSQLANDPPPMTVENAHATLSGLLADSGMIFRRGIAEMFSRLDRRFRSHDGFRIGSRVVLNSAICAKWGGWNHYQKKDRDIRDIERAFYRMDGKAMPDIGDGIVGMYDRNRRMGSYAGTVENDYFRLVVYKNGNAHLWFKRDDLLKQVNKLLAEYYGESLGASPDVAKTDPLSAGPRNTALAKGLGFFETPEAVCWRVIEEADFSSGEQMSVLEPSAGKGRLAKAVRSQAPQARIRCVEIHHERAECLRAQGFDVVQADFLSLNVHDLGQFDRVVMNPPFDRGSDIDHVLHAIRFLKPGGRLVSVMSAGVEFREDSFTAAFRDYAKKHGRFYDLPAESFKESGTMVNTCICTMRKST